MPWVENFLKINKQGMGGGGTSMKDLRVVSKRKLGGFLRVNKVIILNFWSSSANMHIQSSGVAVQMVLVPLS